MTRILLAIVFLIAGHASSPAAAQPAPTPAPGDREISVLSGDLYRLRDGKQFTVFLVTPAGIVVADPLSTATARWLQAELTKRFPGRPVSYVILTHHHADRASGASVFARTAFVLANEKFRDALGDSRRGRVAEYRAVSMPSQTFSVRKTIEIGGAKVDLVEAGGFHAPDMTLLVFPAQRTVFASDAPPFRTAPFTFDSEKPSHVVAWFETVSRIDFDTIVFGDGSTATRGDIAPLAEYLSRLHGAVVTGFERGRSLKKLQDTLLLDAYKALPHYAARRNQIASIYGSLHFRRADLTLSGVANYLTTKPPTYCASYDVCSVGGVVPAGTIGTTISIGRRFGLQAEGTVSEQFWSTRSRPLFDEEVVLRPTSGAAFIRYSPVHNWFSYALLAGVSRTDGDVRGMDRVHGGLIPAGGRHVVSAHDVRYGWTAGIEFSQRVGAMRIVLPIRVTQINGALPKYWLDRISVQAGAGISIPFFRRLE